MSILTVDAWRRFGCRKTENGRQFRVWAPNARRVALCGDFTGWAERPMTRGPGGVWSRTEPDAAPGDIYKYAIEGADGVRRMKADPFALHAETGPATGSKVWDIDGFAWSDEPWMRRRARMDMQKEPMNIYELHLGSWKKSPDEVYPNYRSLAPALRDYCKKMHYTHVELLPLTEYPYEGSWGYQVTGYYAPTSRYGTPQDLMAMIDCLHGGGIGVLLDWVPAHFPRDEHGLARFDGTPLFEYADPRLGEHPEWGTLVFNYASADVRSFLIGSAAFFLENYHIDGIRCDAVSSMLYLDYGRGPGQWLPNRDGGRINYDARDFLRALTDHIRKGFPGAVTVAEESTAYPHVTGPEGLGFDFKWDMGFMHDTLDYFMTDPYFRSGAHEKLTFSMMYCFSEHGILPFSHDEVVHGKLSMLAKMYGGYDQKFATLRALFGFQFAHPGKKLNFMGSEFGQFIEWDYKKELDWFLLDYPMHGAMQRWCAALGAVYGAHPALWRSDGDGWDGFRWLNPDDRGRSSVALLRLDAQGRDALVCAFNFTPQTWTDFWIGLPAAGRLVPLLDSDAAVFGGSGAPFEPIASEKDAFREFDHRASLLLPGLCARYYIFEEEPQ